MSVSIELQNDKRTFRPGDEIAGKVSWALEKTPKQAAVHLYWYTEGKGTQDHRIVESEIFEHPGLDDSRTFSFVAPEAPYSFSGKLISLLWAVRVEAQPADDTERVNITLSRSGEEVVLGEAPERDG